MHRGDSVSRKIWKGCTLFLTWWIPEVVLTYCCGMRRKDIRQAWREKTALFILFVMASCTLLFFIIGVPRLICPKTNIKNLYEIELMNGKDNPYVAAYGRYYDITDIFNGHSSKYGESDILKMQTLFGKDVSQMFFPARSWDANCPGITNPGASWDNILVRDDLRYPPHIGVNPDTQQPVNYLGYMGKFSRGRIGWTPERIAQIGSATMKPIIMYGKVYNVVSYLNGQTKPGFFDDNMYNIFTKFENGGDATKFMNTLRAQNPVYYRNVVNCMDNLFYIGVVDERGSMKCTLADTIMFAASAIVCFVLIIKFFAAFSFGEGTNPSQINKYVMVQVPCYTEDRTSLELTLNSIATTQFDDNYKLAVVLCDGNITGGGNSKSTPDIVLEILYGSEEAADAAKAEARPPMSYHAVGEGRKAENKAQVFSGKYACEGHNMPFIVIVKMGTESEQGRPKPGNRGKRDSQILLMRFLHNIYARNALTEMEYALFYEMKHVIGVSPEKYEFMLMIDADTYITRESITKLVYHMIKDEETVGLCGETLVANENKSWAARIQPYEYFISHHLAKAFESMFGSVTCLPGCFCMYRIRTEKMDPILIAPALIEDYSECNVDTLHKKNLLSLGEDRYLTTLILKHFRGRKTRYTQDAQCHTNVPDSFGVLLSQRRRWINSTIHNLLELVNLEQLCGFCCFSMRFVVFLDLISTIVAPAAVGYVAYLLVTIFFEHSSVYLVSLIMIGAIYGLQMIIIILKMKWAFIVYMIFYIVAMPYFSFYLPLYSFWHMDDFNWGNTRVVLNDGKEEDVFESFDTNSIIRKKIADWEKVFKAGDNEDERAFRDCAKSIKPVESYANLHHLSQYNTITPQDPITTQMAPFPQMTTVQPQPQHQFTAPPSFQPSQFFPPPPRSVYMGGMPYPQSHFGGSQYGGPAQMSSVIPPTSYAPSHVASYVGNVYPPPSTYAPSSYGGDVKSDIMDAEDVAREKRERKERRERRRKRKAEKEARRASEEAEEQVEERVEGTEEPVDINLPQVAPVDNGWDDMLDGMFKDAKADGSN